MLTRSHACNGQNGTCLDGLLPYEHLVQVYGEEGPFLDLLEGFVSGGLDAGEAVIVIATPEHRAALAQRLMSRGVDVHSGRAGGQLLSLDARQCLSRFMVNGRVDERLFEEMVDELVARMRSRRWQPSHSGVRAFGEMVAILWAEGNPQAALHLERLWHRFCREKMFCLLCAYPRSILGEAADECIMQIAAAHSRLLVA